MKSDLALSLKNRINDIAKKGSLSLADLDEIKILLSHCKSEFPDHLTKVVDSFKFSYVESSQEQFLERLKRIIDVGERIPENLNSKPIEANELIPMFELKKADKERILELCIGMRKIIFATIEFDEPHRIRLLNRIAAIESETHKPKGMFDVVRGGISDLGETLGKFGKDIKPLTDRMSEVVTIARKGTKEYDQLPSPDEIKQLPPPEERD